MTIPTRFPITIVLIVAVVVFLPSRVDHFTDSVYALKLVAGCHLDYHTFIHAIALACTGMDYISLWSLPVVQPWEEPTDKPEFWAVWYPRRPDPVTIGGIFGFKDLRSSFV